MNKSHLLGAVSACAITFVSQSAQAVPVTGQGSWETTLQGRDLDGNTATIEAYYDTVLNITWLADTNAGGGAWAAANAWAAGLDVNGITGWRLPTLSPINGSVFNLALSTNGSTDTGTATTTTNGTDGGWRDSSGTAVSEMGHMFYVTLGNLGGCDPTKLYDQDTGECPLQTDGGLSNTGPFSINESSIYWSDTGASPAGAWGFDFGFGFQAPEFNTVTGDAWAVHSGDVGASIVPVPAAVWLFGSGLIGLIGMARRKKAA